MNSHSQNQQHQFLPRPKAQHQQQSLQGAYSKVKQANTVPPPECFVFGSGLPDSNASVDFKERTVTEEPTQRTAQTTQKEKPNKAQDLEEHCLCPITFVRPLNLDLNCLYYKDTQAPSQMSKSQDLYKDHLSVILVEFHIVHILSGQMRTFKRPQSAALSAFLICACKLFSFDCWIRSWQDCALAWMFCVDSQRPMMGLILCRGLILCKLPLSLAR